jgi:hypothetical protein
MMMPTTEDGEVCLGCFQADLEILLDQLEEEDLDE